MKVAGRDVSSGDETPFLWSFFRPSPGLVAVVTDQPQDGLSRASQDGGWVEDQVSDWFPRGAPGQGWFDFSKKGVVN